MGVLMERIVAQKLMEWNRSKRRKPLIVWGARQVGKTYLVRDIFAETCYKDSYIYIDCKVEDFLSERNQCRFIYIERKRKYAFGYFL